MGISDLWQKMSETWTSMVGLGLKKEYHITVLGGRGVGKTSLLATLYHQFLKNPDNQFNLQIIPDDHKTSLIMGDKLDELSSNAENAIITGLGQGSGDKVSYVFTLGLKGFKKNEEMKLVFNDYPGGWLRSDDKCKEITEELSASNVILWVIDAAALMVKDEKNASYFRCFNRPDLEKNY